MLVFGNVQRAFSITLICRNVNLTAFYFLNLEILFFLTEHQFRYRVPLRVSEGLFAVLIFVMSGEEHSGGKETVIKKNLDEFGDSGDKEPFSSDVSLTEADIEALKKFVEEDVEPRMERVKWQEDYLSEDSDIANDESLEKTVESHAELYKLIEEMFRYLRTTRGYDDLFGEVRTPFKKLPKHDARGEMVFLASEVLIKRYVENFSYFNFHSFSR